ncbi:hypothetical protein Pint_08202 [Pistacia integerrima]|uniref:Uncharacterized protein n=1 Tax=Pistacia integerrima TaxID=434235 RepID=A0ACC0XW28_9ROSI|nr:hypothetical protein Pint_08202 [Pistacia integerrima]
MGGNQRASSKISKWLQEIKKVRAYLLEVSIQCGYAGMFVITMVSLNHGMSHYVLAVYRHVVAALVIAPFALVLERGRRPKMTLPIFLQIMLLGFLEPVLDQNLYYMGMKYTTATFASATVNLAPAFTFIMAILLRLDRVNIKKIQSLAKVIGTAITIIGAMVMTLYKGPIIDFIKSGGGSHHRASNESAIGKHWISGTIMLLIGCCGFSGFFILQSITIKKYPAELSLTALVCLMGVVEGAALTLAMERDMNAWKIGCDSRLLAVTYSGLVCSGIGYYVQGVVNKDQGPVFIAAFSPLAMVVTAALGAIFLAEQLYLGSIIGAIFITLGLYTYVWGKSKDLPSSAAPFTVEEGDHQQCELPVTNNDTSIKVENSIDGACHNSTK